MHAVAVMASVKQENRCMCDSAKAATAGYSIVPLKPAGSASSAPAP
eukprot:gene14572-18442_t